MELIDSLAEEFSKETILFVGSGASVSGGLPTWKELICWIMSYTLSQGGDVEGARNYLKSGSVEDLIKATDHLIHALEQAGKSLTDFFNNYEDCKKFINAEPTDIHQLISNLPTRSIITPNYDLLLEKAYRYSLKVVHNGDNEHISAMLRGKFNGYIFKYHGCITNPEQIVLDSSHYRKQIQSFSSTLDSLKSLMQTRNIVFIGFGLDDPDFKFVRDKVIDLYGSSSLELWAFARNCEADVGLFKNKYGIKLINYEGEGDDHNDLHKKLNILLEKIRTHDKEKNETFSIKTTANTETRAKEDFLRLELDKANEEVMPLDKQILGFIALFDTATKNECIQYLTEFKGYKLNTILNRVEHLVEQQLLKATTNHFLLIKKELSNQAAETIEEDILEYLMVRENG
ncbi:MAG TPA: SIR2 family protein [Kangiella sp.]